MKETLEKLGAVVVEPGVGIDEVDALFPGDIGTWTPGKRQSITDAPAGPGAAGTERVHALAVLSTPATARLAGPGPQKRPSSSALVAATLATTSGSRGPPLTIRAGPMFHARSALAHLPVWKRRAKAARRTSTVLLVGRVTVEG